MHVRRTLPFAAVVALALLTHSAAQTAEVRMPGGTTVTTVDFERHVMGLFGRMGCNSGSCHGSFQGKGGFRLSLFGYDPQKDFLALTRDLEGRRINRADPDNSILLLKATGQVEHGGKQRFAKGSWPYQLLREWIVQGADWNKGSGEVQSIAILPAEFAFAKPGQNGKLKVEATFRDGSKEDITALCDFRTNDDAVAEVNPLGQVKGRQPGDTALVVSYRGQVLPVRVLVPVELPAGTAYPQVPEVNYVDREVFAKLRRLNIIPSDLASDGEFLRRVTIDTIGTLPTPTEVCDFLADSRPDKRARKIDELLAHPMHAALWATKFCDVTGNNTDALENPAQQRPKLSQMWHDWLRKRFAENVPYDEIVRGILCATSRDGLTPEEYVKQSRALVEEAAKGFHTGYADRPSLDLFWRRQQNVTVDQWGEKTAAAFMGIRLECAQCHKHPFDRWTQTDYRAYANVFAQISFGVSPEAKAAFNTENQERTKDAKNKNQVAQIREVFVGANPKAPPLADPDTNKPLAPKALGGPLIPLAKGQDARVALFDWLRAQDNPFFARSMANRVWGHYFGVGIVDPVDNFSLANPPSNDKLLDALARDFLDHKFDVRALERAILNSRTYQLASATNATNRLDRINYSHAFVRPMMAEVVVDVVNAAASVSDTFGNDAPPQCRAVEVGVSRLQNPQAGYVFRIFGRPPRTTACDCERAMEPALPQKLYLMADPTLLRKIKDPNNRLKELLANNKDDGAALNELFLATLCRAPTDKEREAFAEFRANAKDRRAAFEDALWALVNTKEFILNH
jgi:hypothetical protein